MTFRHLTDSLSTVGERRGRVHLNAGPRPYLWIGDACEVPSCGMQHGTTYTLSGNATLRALGLALVKATEPKPRRARKGRRS